MQRRRLLHSSALAAIASMVLPGCTGFGGPREVVVSEAELQQRIARSFPLERRVLSLVDVRIEPPRLRLLPERNRIAAELQLTLSEHAFDGRYAGRLAFDSALAIDAADASLRLADVHVTSFEIERGSGGLEAQIRRVGAVLAAQVLEGFVVWRPKPEQLERLAAAGLKPGSIDVTARGIAIRLLPADAR